MKKTILKGIVLESGVQLHFSNKTIKITREILKDISNTFGGNIPLLLEYDQKLPIGKVTSLEYDENINAITATIELLPDALQPMIMLSNPNSDSDSKLSIIGIGFFPFWNNSRKKVGVK